MSVTTPETNSDVTIFYADWCPFCAKLIKNLDRTETPYELVDVEADNTEDINAWIESVNDGNRIVPTVRYDDGTHDTNPPFAQVKAKYEEINP